MAGFGDIATLAPSFWQVHHANWTWLPPVSVTMEDLLLSTRLYASAKKPNVPNVLVTHRNARDP
jgi:hypothetical protein